MMDDILVKIDSVNFFPERQHKTDAGADLKSTEMVTILPGQTKKISSGVRISIPEGYVGLVFPRSGLSTNYGIRLANTVGIIDPEYRGIIYASVCNDSETPYTISFGERIAQLVIIPMVTPCFMAVEELPESSRGCNGFGSTGIR